MHQIDLFVKYPIEVQNEWFQELIHSAKNTEWGSQYSYAKLNSLEQFKSSVPVFKL